MALTPQPASSPQTQPTPDTTTPEPVVGSSVPTPSPSNPRRTWALRLPAFELLWLVFLGPLILLPGRFLQPQWQWVVVALLFAFWPLRLWLLGTLFPPSPVRLAGAALLLTVPLALVISVDKPASWEAAGYLLYGIVAASALVLWPATQRRPQWIAWSVILGTLALSLLGPLIVTEVGPVSTLLDPLRERTSSLTAVLGETINPNILANILLVGFPLLLALALFGGWSRLRGWGQAACWIGALWIVATLIMTDSRGAWMAVAVVVPLLLVLRWPTLGFAVPLLVMGAATVAFVSGVQLLDQLTIGSSASGFEQRVEIWQHGLWLIQAFPLTGAGLGTFSILIPVLYPYDLISPEIVIPDAHNLPIQVGVDLGVPGLVAWLALTLLLLWLAASVFRRGRQRAQRALLRPPTDDAEGFELRNSRSIALAAGTVGSVVAGLVAGIFASANWGVKPAFLPWLIAALILLLYSQSEAEDAVPSRHAEAATPVTPHEVQHETTR